MIILLYGILKEKYGHRHEFQVSCAAEMIRALKANFPGFEKDFFDKSNAFSIFVGYESVTFEDCLTPIENTEVCRIVPTINGSGGIGEAVAWYIASQFAISTTTLALITFAVNAVVALAINGIAQALFAPPKPKSAGSSERANNQPSYVFNGAVNTVNQGNAIAVGYGRLRIGSQVISAGLSVEQIPI